jgi:hypothetical protein
MTVTDVHRSFSELSTTASGRVQKLASQETEGLLYIA